MNELKKQFKQVYKKIKEYDTIVIFRHELPDYDALGTQFGLRTFIRDNFPEKKVYAVGKNHVTFTDILYPKADELDEEFYKQKFLAIIVDTGNTKRIDDKHYEMAAYKIKFDHHPPVEQYADINIVVDELSSASELLTEFVISQKNYPLSRLAAMYFYSGLVGDSGRFLFPSTTPRTLAVASKLLETGFNPSFDVYLKMYQKHLSELEIQKYVLNHFKVSKAGVAYYVLSDEIQKELHITPELGKINLSLFSNFIEIPVWCSITEDKSINEWRVSLRSKATVINGVAEKYNGGGHIYASGCRLKSLDELDSLIADLDKVILEK